MTQDKRPGNAAEKSWDFWIDRGGTFTDVVARRPEARSPPTSCCRRTPGPIEDAAVQGIRDLLGLKRRRADPARTDRRHQDGHHGRHQCAAGAPAASARCSSPRGDFETRSRSATRRGRKFSPATSSSPTCCIERVVEVDERVRADGTVEAHARSRRAAWRTRTRACRRHQGRRDRVHAQLPLSRA